jgi:hypothetical protein
MEVKECTEGTGKKKVSDIKNKGPQRKRQLETSLSDMIFTLETKKDWLTFRVIVLA